MANNSTPATPAETDKKSKKPRARKPMALLVKDVENPEPGACPVEVVLLTSNSDVALSAMAEAGSKGEKLHYLRASVAS